MLQFLVKFLEYFSDCWRFFQFRLNKEQGNVRDLREKFDVRIASKVFTDFPLDFRYRIMFKIQLAAHF